MKALLASLVSLSAILSIGCGKPSLTMSYTIILDKDMSEAESEAVISGSYAWQDQVPSLTLSYIVSSCNGVNSIPLHSICVHSDQTTPKDSDGNIILGTTSFDTGLAEAVTDRASIVLHSKSISGSKLPNALIDTATHELGHALSGRGGHIASGNLMAPMVDNSKVVEKITDSDVDYFWSMR